MAQLIDERSRAEEQRARSAHRSAVETTPQFIASYLSDALGVRLLAYTVNVSDPKTVTRWAKAEREPTADHEARLRNAFYVFQLLSNDLESAHTVRAWFGGLNPLLGEESPATALREGQFQ